VLDFKLALTQNNKGSGVRPPPFYRTVNFRRLLWCKGEKTPWSESASELYGPRDRRLLAKLVPTFVDRGRHVVSVTDSYGHILVFLDRSRYFFFQVAF
jgi:hypothetical protein